MSVVPYSEPDRARAWVGLLGPAVELAKQIATTPFVPGALRNSVPAITAAILYGDELGFDAMTSLREIVVIDGRPYVYAEALRALVLRDGHELWIEESTTTKATWAGRRRGTEQIGRVTWTLDDARRAKLDGRPNWRNYPRPMLSARSSAELCRAMFPDVILGLSAMEELDDFDAAVVSTPAGSDDARTRDSNTRKRPRKESTVRAPVLAAVVDENGPDSTPGPDRPRPLLPCEVDNAPASDIAAEAVGLLGVELDAALIPTPDTYEPIVKLEGSRPAASAQLKRIGTLFTSRGIAGTKRRAEMVSDWIGRTVTAANQLTRREADRVIEQIETLPETPAPASGPDAPLPLETPSESNVEGERQ